MSGIKVDQKYILELETENEDLESATELRIDYTDPNGGKDQLTATPKVGDVSKARVTITSATNKINGDWRFEVYALIGGEPFYGTTFIQRVDRHFR